MAALSVSVIGGPMTMAMLVLEVTHDFGVTGAVIAASLVASTIVRELFGFSFSTWRLHLRGETVKSARDVGWMKNLTAGSMMRRETRATSAEMPIAEFRHKFPLGSATRVTLFDANDGYAGIVTVADAFAEGIDQSAPVAAIASEEDRWLTPEMDIGSVMTAFDAAGVDELAVLASSGAVLGRLSETHVRRRYAEEVEKSQRELFGEI
jgi:CIC family chloride channel protein